ncbi:family 10 glycosylhydrolase [Gemmatimonas sp.]
MAPGGSGETAPAIRREFRGAWVASVANIDWPSKPGLSAWDQQAELRAILDRARALHLNAILLQVRPAGDALYASPYEPWSAYLTGVEGRAPEPYYDPLAFAVKEAHERGLELHAWLNPYRARHPSANGDNARTHVANAHPEWVRRYGKYLWMDPGEPGVLAHSVKVALDVVRRYDVDGIHVDDYFYPYPEADSTGTEVPFPDSGSYARYRARGGQRGVSDWRRWNVDRYVEHVYRGTKQLKPWVKVGISPFGIWRPGFPSQVQGFDSYEKLAGDSRKWLREGWIDYFTPQLYWPIARTAQSYPVLLDWWIGENIKARHMWPGHNSSRAGSGGAEWGPEELNNQVRLTRATTATGQGATGDIFFSMRSLMPAVATPRTPVSVGVATAPPTPASTPALADRLQAELYQEPALIPASPWLGNVRPARPRLTVRRVEASGDEVVELVPPGNARWITVQVRRAERWRTWVLPASTTRVIIGTATDQPADVVVVRAIHRNGRESLPVTATGVRN